MNITACMGWVVLLLFSNCFGKIFLRFIITLHRETTICLGFVEKLGLLCNGIFSFVICGLAAVRFAMFL